MSNLELLDKLLTKQEEKIFEKSSERDLIVAGYVIKEIFNDVAKGFTNNLLEKLNQKEIKK